MVCRLLTDHRDAILEIAARYGASDVRVFGSMARGEDDPESDVDFLVSLDAGRTLLDHLGLRQDLEDLLGHRVDVVVNGGLSPYLCDRILAETLPL